MNGLDSMNGLDRLTCGGGRQRKKGVSSFMFIIFWFFVFHFSPLCKEHSGTI